MIVSPLYAIVDHDFLRSRGLDLREFATELRQGGVTLVQWRCKSGTPSEVLAGAAVLREVFAGSACLIMNDRADLAALAGFNGVHVGQGDLPVAAAKAALASAPHASSKYAEAWGTRLTGVSTHTGTQVTEAEAGGADYLAVGPVFATASKRDASPVVGLDGVRMARGLTAKPLVAIGGITLANCRSVRDAGADSVAVISGLLVEGRTVRETVRDFLDRLR